VTGNSSRWSSRGVAASVAVSSVLILSACASGGEAASSLTPEQSKACVDKANNGLKEWSSFPTTLPASPPARYTTLDKRPPSGKRIVFVRQNFPAVASTTEAARTAAEALGWTLEPIVYDNSVPDFTAKMEQAIATKPDFIMETGLPTASFRKQIDEAKAAGITVVTASTSDAPVSVPGYGGSGNGTATAKLIARIHADKMLSDSKCAGSTVIFSLDYPILKVSEDEYSRAVHEQCPDCRVDVVKLQAKDLGTPAATAQMVSKLQADPSVKYVYTMIGDVATGLAQALKPAGIDDVKIFGQVPNASSIADLRNGTNAWWINQSSAINGFDMVDMAARIVVTGQVQGDPGGYPLALLTPANVPPGQDAPVIPANVLDLFKATWRVGQAG
jgi:ABC-type sugar transport system substrate-binding protein